MVQVDITQAIATLRKFSQLTERETGQVLARALNRTMSKAQTLENRGIRQVYNIKMADLAKKLKVGRAFPSKLEAKLDASTSTLSITRFVQNMGDLSGGSRDGLVELEIFKGKRTFAPKGAFLVPGKNFIAGRGKYEGGKFVFNKSRKPIAPIKTASPAGVGINEKIQSTLPNPLQETLNDRIAREIAFVLR